MPPKRSRNWCWTAFDPNLTEVWLCGLSCKYWCYGIETCPATKKVHWQGYMELEHTKTLTALKALAPAGLHLEIRKGTSKQAQEYCKKDGAFHEMGTMSVQGKRSDLISIKEDIDAGKGELEIADSYFAQYCQYRKSFDAYRQLKSEPRTWETEVHVLWGDTGTGKTRYCIDKGASMIEFDKSGFCHGYKNQSILLLDDFDPETLTRSGFLRLTDRYTTTVNIKGDSKNWNPRVIYITTNFDPRNWYHACPAIRRRFTSITHYPALRTRPRGRPRNPYVLGRPQYEADEPPLLRPADLPELEDWP